MLQSEVFWRWFGIINAGASTIIHLYQHSFNEFRFPLPSIDVQRRIADYLDSKCSQIDSIIEKQEAIIEKLKEYKLSVITEAVTKGLDPNVEMKDSGIEWIDSIPVHYDVVRFQDYGDFRKGPFGSAITKNMFVEKGDDTYKVYEQKNAIYKNNSMGYYYITHEKYRELECFAVEPGDIIVSCAGTIGECYILPENSEKGIINQALMRIRIKEGYDARYVVLLFSSVLKYYSDKYSNGSAIKNIPPFSVLKKIRVPSFTIGEQIEIVEWLECRVSQIDSEIDKLNKSRLLLRQFEKSLIYEVVTGKREV